MAGLRLVIAGSGQDNRNLIDNSANQGLSHEDIERMKAEGARAEDILGAHWQWGGWRHWLQHRRGGSWHASPSPVPCRQPGGLQAR